MKLFKNIQANIIKKEPKNWAKFLHILEKYAMEEDKNLIKMSIFLKILKKFRLALNDKQQEWI